MYLKRLFTFGRIFRLTFLVLLCFLVTMSLPAAELEPETKGFLNQAETDALTEHRCPLDDGALWWTGDTLWTGQTPDDEFGETVFKHICMKGHEWWLLAEMMEYGPSVKGPKRRA